MGLGNLIRPDGATHKKKRVARGDSSGWGGTAGRGHKGQKARSGAKIRRGFEGGQMPLQRRLPKRGFKNIYRKPVSAVNVRELVRFEAGAVIEPKMLKAAGLIRSETDLVKILGVGELDRALTVRAQAFSKSAREKIEQAGGKAELIAPVKRVKTSVQED
jgi:large subunit ribosomal protein L15